MRSRRLPSRSARAGERAHDVGEGREVDAAAGAHRLDAEGDGEVALAGAGRAEEVDDLVALDERELGEREDAAAVERRLEGEVEALQRLDRGQPRHAQRRLDPRPLAPRELLGQQGVDCLHRADLAALELLDRVVEHLKGPRHAQAHQVLAHPLQGAGPCLLRLHAGSPWPASRRPTAS